MIGYFRQVILYNCTGGEIGTVKQWYGTVLNDVRVDLKKSVNIGETGQEAANTCTFSVYDKDLPKGYLEPEQWRTQENRGAYFTLDDTSFIIITYAPELGAKERNLPLTAKDSDFDAGLIEYLKTQGHVYRITGTAHYSLIPHWEISAA